MSEGGLRDPERDSSPEVADTDKRSITRTNSRATGEVLFGPLPPASRRSRSVIGKDTSPLPTPERSRSRQPSPFLLPPSPRTRTRPPSPFRTPGTPPRSPQLEWEGNYETHAKESLINASDTIVTFDGQIIDGRDRVFSDEIPENPASITAVLQANRRRIVSSSDETFLDGEHARRRPFPTDKGLTPLLNQKRKRILDSPGFHTHPWILQSPVAGPSRPGGSNQAQRPPTSTPVAGIHSLAPPPPRESPAETGGKARTSLTSTISVPPSTDPAPLQRIDAGTASSDSQRSSANPIAQPTPASPRLDERGQPSEPLAEESGSASQRAEVNPSNPPPQGDGERVDRCGSTDQGQLEAGHSVPSTKSNFPDPPTNSGSGNFSAEDDFISSALITDKQVEGTGVYTDSSSASRGQAGSCLETGRDSAYGLASLSRNENTAGSADDNNTATNEDSQSQQKSADKSKQTLNRVNMDLSAIVELRIELDRILEVVEHDILTVAASEHYPLDFIRRKLSVGEKEKSELTKTSAALKHKDAEYFNQHYKDNVLKIKYDLSEYLRSGQRYIQSSTVKADAAAAAKVADKAPSPGSSASSSPTRQQSKKKRVDKFAGQLLALSAEWVEKLKEVADAEVTTDKEADNVEHKLKMYVKDTDDHIKDLSSLSSDAYQCGDETRGIALENSIVNLKKRRTAAATSVMDMKAMRGMDGRASSAQHKLTDLKLPTFGGEMTAGKMDFYTFKTECTAYFRAKGLTKEEECVLLRKTALTGPAKTLVYHLEEADVIWDTLQDAFGMTSVLVNNKIEEIKKLGNCPPTDPEKKRDWVINAHSKLTRLLAVATEHNKLDDVYHSSVIGELKNALPYKLMDIFRKKVREAERTEKKESSKPELFAIFLEFLRDTVEEETFHMRFEMNTEGTEVKKPKPKEPAKHPQPAVRFQKKNYNNQPAQPAAQPAAQQYPAQPRQGGPRQGGGGGPPQNKGSNNSRTGHQRNNNKPTGPQQRLRQPAGYCAPQGVYCRVCNEEHTHLFLCRNYQSKDDLDRRQLIDLLKVCMRCMRSDSQVNLTQRSKWWKDHQVNCVTDYFCTAGTCDARGPWRQIHVLICSEHCEENKEIIDRFLGTIDPSKLIPNPKFYYMEPANYQMNYPVCNKDNFLPREGETILPDNDDPPIYLCQTLPGRDGQTLLCFWDTGCTGGSMSERAYKLLETENVRPGPTTLNVAGGNSFVLEGGDEQFVLELDTPGHWAMFTCINMKEVTAKFPVWPLQVAFEEISSSFFQENPDADPLPQVDDTVGGTSVDIMLGMRYNQHFPELLYMLPSGLAIYRAKVRSASGRQGVLGGCHASWQEAAAKSMFLGPTNYFTQEIRAFRSTQRALRFSLDFSGLEVDDEAVMLEDPVQEDLISDSIISGVFNSSAPAVCSSKHCDQHKVDGLKLTPSEWEVGDHAFTIMQDEARFWGTEDCGAVAEYRCVTCRNCSRCKDSENQEMVSIRQEREQGILEASVVYNEEKRRLEGTLPFIEDPGSALAPNKYIAEKIFNAQMNTVLKRPEIKPDILKAINKLRDRGFVVREDEVPEEDAKKMEDLPGEGYFLPWSIVLKPTSFTSPARMVFNGSSTTSTGKSLNNIVAKGENTLAKILDILIRFRSKPFAMSGDIRMAYNGIWLYPRYYKYQKFLWKEDLDPSNPLIVMIIVTLIYGIKSSGQQTLAGFCALAEYCAEHYPEHYDGAEAVKRDFYMDDLMKSIRSIAEGRRIAESIKFTLALGDLEIKAFTFSGESPSEEISADGIHIGALGYLWDSKKDTVSLDIKPLFFGKPKKGAKPELIQGDFKDKLRKVFTKRTILGKVAGVYDPLGLVTPISAKLKLDLHRITDLKVDWDQALPDFLLDTWVDNLQMIQKLNSYSFKRAVVYPEARDLGFDLIVSMDASQDICIAAVHARSQMKDGSFKCQLLSAKSKLVRGVTIPRAELKAAVLGTVLAHVNKRNVLEEFKSVIFVTDSVIVLYWIQQDYRPLQVAVRNAVIEIRRLSLPDQWYHVDTYNNVADTGTRVASLADLNPDSDWLNGRPWMRLPRDQFPLRQAEDITLDNIQLKDAAKEMKSRDVSGHVLDGLVNKVGQRYSFSRYLVDPCRLPWPRVVRTMCYVIRAAKTFLKDTAVPTGLPDKKELENAENYFFMKGTEEVKHFCKEKQYKDISYEKDKVLIYNGRILESEEYDAMENSMLDVDTFFFNKPILDRYSPVSYSIMVWSHSVGAHHKNAIATLRESLDHAYIIGGRDLAIQVRKSCIKCRRFKQELVEVKMGDTHKSRLTVAPAFFYTQIDLMGPMEALCEHNHRSAVKIWGAVFKCPATGAVAVHAMAKYDATAFIKAYNRFASRYGHPNKVFIDEGSQLKAAVKSMEISMVDLTRGLNVDYQVGIEHQTSPVGGHNWTGMVERSIKEIKRLFMNTFRGLKLDVLGYETAFAWTANELNNLPIGLGSKYRDLDHLDLLTPSRLLHGRNNKRALVGCTIMKNTTKAMQQLEDVYDAWWNTWRTEKMQDFIPQPQKWRKTGVLPKEGDIVIFPTKDPNALLGEMPWKLGRVRTAEAGSDDLTRVVVIEYRIPGEETMRETRRSVRQIAILFDEESLEMVDCLNAAAKKTNIHYTQIHASK